MEARPQYTKEEWTQIHVRIPRKYYDMTTDKAQAFTLWGKKKMYFASSLIRDWKDDGEEIAFTIPKWYVAKHGLKSIVEDFDKHHFPTKKELREQAAGTLNFESVDVQTMKVPEQKEEAPKRYQYNPDDLEW